MQTHRYQADATLGVLEPLPLKAKRWVPTLYYIGPINLTHFLPSLRIYQN